METKPDLPTLMARKLEGTITPEELAELQGAIATSTEAAQEFEVFERIWTASRSINVPVGIGQDARWQRLQSKIANDKPAGRSRKLLWLRYAAAVALFAVLAVVYRLNNDDWVTISTRADESLAVTLPDSSIVRLEGNAVLSYHASEWSSKRDLRLTGNAFFDVRHTGTSFVVELNNASVAVLGTSFRVSSSMQYTVVSCFTGKVTVANRTADQTVILTPGLGAAVRGDAVSDPYKVSSADRLADDLNFHHAPLLIVFESLANHHNKQIIMPPEIDSVSFTGNLAGSSLESALKTVCLSAGLEFTISSDSVVIKSR
ncbi:FecR family protein [Chryseolinea sp. T2]|uniref:FecR family protein n=1 Tax=Chryseolinea sp. T2 TaxID=3129255 RepID=UPI0030785D32